VIAAHCDSCSSWCSKTSRTARSRTSGANLFGLAMAPSFPRKGASENLGAIHAEFSLDRPARPRAPRAAPPVARRHACAAVRLFDFIGRLAALTRSRASPAAVPRRVRPMPHGGARDRARRSAGSVFASRPAASCRTPRARGSAADRKV
jgi:hypothetical protein